MNEFFKRPLVNIRDKRLLFIIGSPFAMLMGLIIAEGVASLLFGGSIGVVSVGSDVLKFLFSIGFYDTSNGAEGALANEVQSIMNKAKIGFWTLLSILILFLLFKKPNESNEEISTS